MRSLRVLGAAVVLLGAAGCTDAGAGAASDPAGSTSAAPGLAGSAEAQELGALPAGPATGTAVLSYTGVGEVRAPFDGECSRTGDATRVDGSADSARIRLDAGPDGTRLVLDDLGLSTTSDLATGRYEVVGDHLSIAADLVQAGQAVGSVELEVDCGG